MKHLLAFFIAIGFAIALTWLTGRNVGLQFWTSLIALYAIVDCALTFNDQSGMIEKFAKRLLAFGGCCVVFTFYALVNKQVLVGFENLLTWVLVYATTTCLVGAILLVLIRVCQAASYIVKSQTKGWLKTQRSH